MDMCSGPLFKKILIFALPIIAMNLLQLLFNAADMVVAGRFSGKEARRRSRDRFPNQPHRKLLHGLVVGTSVVVAQETGQ
jgi:Na+-driven multidrug efflux pump